jgi:hypothetical protein
MKKKDLKKLAMYGITGGLIVASQGSVQADTQSEENNSETLAGLLAAGCGGGTRGNGYNGCNGGTQPSGCNSGTRANGYNGCNGGTRGNGYNGCGGTRGNVIADADEDTKSSAATGQLMTEDQLMSQLNDQGKQMYKSMNPEGKAMAIKLASRSCKGTNDCKGQNSCKSTSNSCAGKSSCAGTSQCSFKDKNLAVKVAAQQQVAKRSMTNAGSTSGSY